ncbi:hypothetical protein [Scytonema sp. NUACC21]
MPASLTAKQGVYRVAIDIGLDSIRQQCQHFNQWLLRLENMIL